MLTFKRMKISKMRFKKGINQDITKSSTSEVMKMKGALVSTAHKKNLPNIFILVKTVQVTEIVYL